MDLKEYENAKFELSDILRAAVLVAKRDHPDDHQPYADLFARLAEDRFNVVVVGRFSRGKTSLMNAMLETERLPTGIVPLTSVITTVAYGSAERAFIEYESSRLASEIPLAALPDYVTQQKNPGNERHVTVARVELPCEMLRRGFHLVDTPGLGSSIVENTRTTEGFLSEADAFILVTSYDSPLSEEELRVLRGVASAAERVFLVINKQDGVSAAEKDEVLGHVRDQARRVYGEVLPRIFSVSARDALDAIKRRDQDRFAASGVPDLKETLVRFLLEEKRTQLLLRMSERIARLPNSPAEIERVGALYRRIAHQRLNATPQEGPVLGADNNEIFAGCEICARVEREIYAFLCTYQYDVAARADTRDSLAKGGGLCEFHTWQYDGVASPRGTCIAFSGVLTELAARLRRVAHDAAQGAVSGAVGGLRADHQTCPLCRVRTTIEVNAIADLARQLEQEERRQPARRFAGLCMPHLQRLAQSIGDEALVRDLLLSEADTLDRVADNMQRYALKHDGIRRFLASEEETVADRRALMLLAGHRNVNAVWKST